MAGEDQVPLKEATLQLAEDVLRDRLQAQRTAIERIETKATVLLGFGAAAAQFVLRSDASGGWLTIALVFYGLTLLGDLPPLGSTSTNIRLNPGDSCRPIWDCQRHTPSTF